MRFSTGLCSFPQDNEEFSTGFPQFYKSFPQGKSYKPLQTLQLLINLWKTITTNSSDTLYYHEQPVENYFSTGRSSIILTDTRSYYLSPRSHHSTRSLGLSSVSKCVGNLIIPWKHLTNKQCCLIINRLRRLKGLIILHNNTHYFIITQYNTYVFKYIYISFLIVSIATTYITFLVL